MPGSKPAQAQQHWSWTNHKTLKYIRICGVKLNNINLYWNSTLYLFCLFDPPYENIEQEMLSNFILYRFRISSRFLRLLYMYVILARQRAH